MKCEVKLLVLDCDFLSYIRILIIIKYTLNMIINDDIIKYKSMSEIIVFVISYVKLASSNHVRRNHNLIVSGLSQ